MADGLEKGGVEVTLKNVINTDVNELNRYDTVIFFCATKGVGELKDDSIDLHADMKNIILAAKKPSCFTSSNSNYNYNFIILEDVVKTRSAT